MLAGKRTALVLMAAAILVPSTQAADPAVAAEDRQRVEAVARISPSVVAVVSGGGFSLPTPTDSSARVSKPNSGNTGWDVIVNYTGSADLPITVYAICIGGNIA